MKIGLDFDGVIANAGKLKSDGAKHLYGVYIPPERFKKDIIFREGILTVEQYRKLQKSIYETRELGLLMELVEGALHYIQKLLDEGHEITVITSRSDLSLEVAKEWAFMQGLDLDFVGVGYNTSKLEAAKGMDIFIDDDLDKLEPLVGFVPNLFLFSWGYSEHINEDGVAERVYSWEEFYGKILSIAELYASVKSS